MRFRPNEKIIAVPNEYFEFSNKDYHQAGIEILEGSYRKIIGIKKLFAPVSKYYFVSMQKTHRN